ncbi:MAG: quinolinate synthase NadA [Candidatus Fermentibacteraceae bacterium]
MDSERILARIGELRESRNAVILAHSYQPPEIQDMADFVGDSLGLSRKAAETDAEVVVFCGVRFMAETASILSPAKRILLPAPNAGCPLADSMTAEDLRLMQARHPDARAVVYVNSSVELKAESWACCTSANAVEVVDSAPGDSVIFGPDRNLGIWVDGHVDREVHIFEGACLAHANADLDDLRGKMERWPDAEVMSHPETPPAMWELSDFIGGTGDMIRRVPESGAQRFIVGTEEGMAYRLRTLYPDREFVPGGRIWCENMKKISPADVLASLEDLEPEVSVPPGIRERALEAVRRMTAAG